MKIYISGPIRGIADGNRAAFQDAEGLFSRWGFEVINPREFQDNSGKSWFECLTTDLKALLACDSIAMLPGWQQSKGATLEFLVAFNLGYALYDHLGQVLSAFKFMGQYGLEAIMGTENDIVISADPEAPKVKAPVVPKETIIQEADRLVNGDRQADYGHPLDDFGKTAQIWGALKPGVTFTPEDVALFQVAVKLSREVHAPKRDNIVDAHGYLMTYDKIGQERQRREWVVAN